MIYAEARDALTRPQVTVAKLPGMDELAWIEVDTEEDIRTDLSQPMNAAMMAAEPELTIAPWPLPVSPQAPLDLTMRYEWLAFHLMEWDTVHEEWTDVPAGVATILSDPDRSDPTQRAMTKMQSPAEVRAQNIEPEKWIRLPFVNESGGTGLKDPVAMIWNGLQASRFTIELPDNDVFTPIDLTHPERYSWLGDDGKPIENGEMFAGFGDRARVVLYLRPRRWKWTVIVFCLFEYEDWWGGAPSYETFVSTFYRRPPFYPVRHNLAVTNQSNQYNLINYNGQPRTYDAGIDSTWDLCWHSRDMRSQIIAAQWFTMCEAYIFVSNEPPDISIQAAPPRFGEIVLGIGFVDEASGRESRVWAQVIADESTVYPLRTVGQFLANWQV